MARLPPNIDLELTLDQESYWRNSLKVLTRCDVDSSSRLLLPKKWVETQVLRGMDQNLKEQCRSINGKEFEVRDVDTNTKHDLVLKQWASNSFVLTTNWKRQFVNRRTLEEGDEIGLLWDGSKFYFSLRRKSYRVY